MDYGLTLAILATCVSLYSAFLQREQIKLMRGDSLKGVPQSPVIAWWRSPSIIALSIITVLAWVPWGLTTWQNWKLEKIGVRINAWGPASPDFKTLQIVVSGSELRSTEKLVAIVMHYRGDGDIMDWTDIQVSLPYDFRIGTQPLYIKPDEHFLGEVQSGMRSTQYFLIMVPAQLSRDQFHSLRQAVSLGAKILWNGAGPP